MLKMKENIIKITAIIGFVAFSLSSCSKENFKLKPLKLLSLIKFFEVRIFVPLLKTSRIASKPAPVNATGFPKLSTNRGTICKDFGPKILSTAIGMVLTFNELAEISLGSASFAKTSPKIFISPKEGGPVLDQSMPFFWAT